MNLNKMIMLVLGFIVAVSIFQSVVQSSTDVESQTVEYKVYDEVGGNWTTQTVAFDQAVTEDSGLSIGWTLVGILGGLGFLVILFKEYTA